MLLKFGWSVEGDASTALFGIGTGTRDEEKGVAPAEKGTLGLFVPLRITEPFEKGATNEPARNRLASEEFVVIENTSPESVNLPKGGADQEAEATSYTATAFAGDVNFPPAQTFLRSVSQKSALTWPLGLFEPRAAKDPEEGV